MAKEREKTKLTLQHWDGGDWVDVAEFETTAAAEREARNIVLRDAEADAGEFRTVRFYEPFTVRVTKKAVVE